MNFGIIGCGAVSKKRIFSMGDDDRLVSACSHDINRAKEFCDLKHGAIPTTNPLDIANNKDISAVFISGKHCDLAPPALECVKRGKHVLIEKPCAISSSELIEMKDAAKQTGALIKLGYNHRHHPSFLAARKMVDDGLIGKLMFIRGCYGHGGRINYDGEWRADVSKSGGGELIDKGVHLIDLSRWFLGEFSEVNGNLQSYFWKKMIDDNAFVSLKTQNNNLAWLHVSCTEWKNKFTFEIYGETGKILIDGLGRSYGTETLSLFVMSPEMGPPNTMVYKYDGDDNSWKHEQDEFKMEIEKNIKPSPSVDDGIEILKIVEKLYKK